VTALNLNIMRGKSGLHGNTVPDNFRQRKL